MRDSERQSHESSIDLSGSRRWHGRIRKRCAIVGREHSDQAARRCQNRCPAKNKDMLISEMVPVKQSVKNWTEMVTVQVFYGLKATPDQFKAKIECGLAAACPKSESR